MKSNPIKYNRKLPVFCTYCGASMKKGKVRSNDNAFDPYTGLETERVEYKLRCAKTVINFLNRHDSFLIIDDPEDKVTGEPHRTILRASI